MHKAMIWIEIKPVLAGVGRVVPRKRADVPDGEYEWYWFGGARAEEVRSSIRPDVPHWWFLYYERYNVHYRVRRPVHRETDWFGYLSKFVSFVAGSYIDVRFFESVEKTETYLVVKDADTGAMRAEPAFPKGEHGADESILFFFLGQQFRRFFRHEEKD